MSVGLTFDPTSLGTDVNLALTDLAGVWGLATGLLNLGNALVRRLTCPAGGLFCDSNYGHDVSGLINGPIDQSILSRERGQISAECEKDERIDSCSALVTFDQGTQALYITLVGTLVTGTPFQFVIGASSVTVALLAVNGVLTGNSNIAAVGGNVQLVVGPPGPAGEQAAGVPGPPGPSGTAQVSMDFDETIGVDSSGAEVVVYQRVVNFDALGGTVTFDLTANVYSAAGTATFKMSYGGTSRVANGTQVGSSMTTGSASPVTLDVSASITNPTGKKLVKITVQSSGAGIDAGIEDRILTIR